ncbi:MAG TPA: CBS domain-containing protein [Polyangiaceae bacterium]|nr:CBS domain-containing protein [Polyangiaceae bacterium]
MDISAIMTTAVHACSPDDMASTAASIMWNRDCGTVPVVDSDLKVVGIITDRDICMATYTRGQPPQDIRVADVMSHPPFCCSPRDSVIAVERMMQERQIRRVPVVSDGRLVGIVSLGDLARRLRTDAPGDQELSTTQVAQTLGAISYPHPGRAPLAAF